MHIKKVLKRINELPRRDNGHVYLSALKPLVTELKKNHSLAIQLWDTKNHAARCIAVRIAEPDKVDEILLEKWVEDLDEWELTDAFTGHLVRYTRFAIPKAYEWAKREPEFIRRASFSTIAQMAWAKNDFNDKTFIDFLQIIEQTASDKRLYVKKAVNWALRDIGKRNETLQIHAQNLAKTLQESDNKTARWIGKHRFHEFV